MQRILVEIPVEGIDFVPSMRRFLRAEYGFADIRVVEVPPGEDSIPLHITFSEEQIKEIKAMLRPPPIEVKTASFNNNAELWSLGVGELIARIRELETSLASANAQLTCVTVERDRLRGLETVVGALQKQKREALDHAREIEEQANKIVAAAEKSTREAMDNAVRANRNYTELLDRVLGQARRT